MKAKLIAEIALVAIVVLTGMSVTAGWSGESGYFGGKGTAEGVTVEMGELTVNYGTIEPGGPFLTTVYKVPLYHDIYYDKLELIFNLQTWDGKEISSLLRSYEIQGRLIF